MDLDDLLRFFDVDVSKITQKKVTCHRCDKRQAEYIIYGSASDEYPDFSFYCQKCLTKRDFNSMVTSQIMPSGFMALQIATGLCKKVDAFKSRPVKPVEVDIANDPGFQLKLFQAIQRGEFSKN